ncbi:MAG: hypothetical protein SNJ60_07450, partial [Pseudanabaenaceae cyanobacterium]
MDWLENGGWWPVLAAFNLVVVGLLLWSLRPKPSSPTASPAADAATQIAALKAECKRLQAALQTQSERDRQ